MALIVTGRSRDRFSHLFDSMFRDRKRVFLDRLHWDLEALEDGREIDQFDGPDAVYIIEGTADSRHLASYRLLPTTKPHLLSEVFPFLCEMEIPRGEDIWELTRLCICPDVSKEEALRLRRVVWMGVLEFAVANGVRLFTGVTHASFLPQVLAAGLDLEPLGMPQNYKGVLIGDHLVHFSKETIRLVERRLGVAAKLPTRMEAAVT